MSYHTSDDWEAAVEVFNGTVIHAYQNTDQYGTNKMIYAGATSAETVNYPVMQPSQATNEPDGVDVVVEAGAYRANTNDILTTELPVDVPLKDIRLIPLDQIQVRPDLRLPDNYARMLGRSIAEGKGIRLTGLLANAAEDASGGVENVHTVDLTQSPADRAADIRDTLNTIAALMDENGVPADGRHVMLRATYWYDLLQLEGIYTKEYGGMAMIQHPGQYIDYANFRIHLGKVGFTDDYTSSEWTARMNTISKYQYNASGNTLAAVCWHEESWALRHWKDPTVLNDWVPMRDSYKLEARLIMGAVAIQAEDAIFSIIHGT